METATAHGRSRKCFTWKDPNVRFPIERMSAFYSNSIIIEILVFLSRRSNTVQLFGSLLNHYSSKTETVLLYFFLQVRNSSVRNWQKVPLLSMLCREAE